jgi:hypothetical protein
MHAWGGAFRSREIYREASRPGKSEHNHSRLTFFLRLFRKREEFGALCPGYLLKPGVPSTPYLCELSNPSLTRFSFFLAHFTSCPPRRLRGQLGGLSEWPLMIGAVLLTALNDNAAITYLASLVPGFSPSLKYAVMAGAISGGGLTVIAKELVANPERSGEKLVLTNNNLWGKNAFPNVRLRF